MRTQFSVLPSVQEFLTPDIADNTSSIVGNYCNKMKDVYMQLGVYVASGVVRDEDTRYMFSNAMNLIANLYEELDAMRTEQKEYLRTHQEGTL